MVLQRAENKNGNIKKLYGRFESIGESVRAIIYGAHVSLATPKKSHKLKTNITSIKKHDNILLLFGNNVQ